MQIERDMTNVQDVVLRGRRGRAGVSGWLSIGIALLLSLGGLNAYAQYDNGSLVGTIKDATGAPIPNASVTITNTDTAAATAVKTDSAGDYEVPSLHVGVYKISATATGFSDEG